MSECQLWIFFSNFCSNFLKMKRTGVVAKSKKFFFNLQTHWKTAFSFLSLVKRTIILVIFFKFSRLILAKKVESGIWLGFAGNGTQNLTFFSQFVKIFKVSSLDFSKKQFWQNWHIFLTKISQIFEISVISFEYRKRFERKGWE